MPPQPMTPTLRQVSQISTMPLLLGVGAVLWIVATSLGHLYAFTGPSAGGRVIPAPAPRVSPPASAQLAHVASVSTDPFQVCAREALGGKWGPLPAWKRRAYQAGIIRGVRVKGCVFVTWYGPQEGRDGQIDSRGVPCTSRTASCNRLPRGTYVWVSNPCGIKEVLDRGASWNDSVADRRGADLWIDLWARQPFGTRMAKYAIIGR